MIRNPRSITPTERVDAVRRLREIGGVYDLIADAVEHDTSSPSTAETSKGSE